MVTTSSLPSLPLEVRPADELRGQIQRLLVRNRALLHAAADARSTEATLRARIAELEAALSARVDVAPVATPAPRAPVKRTVKASSLTVAAALKVCRPLLVGETPRPGCPAVPAVVVAGVERTPARPASPARLLGCVRIEGVAGVAVVTATDLQSTLVITTATPWPVGAVRVVEGKQIAAVKGEVEPAPGLDVRVGGATIKGWDAADWPVTPGLEGGATVTLDGPALASALRRILPCVAPEYNRYGLNGAHVEVVGDDTRVVATDGNRLAWATVPGAWALPRKMILPRPAIVALLPVLAGSVSIRTGDRMIEVQAGPVAATVRLLESDFPDYRQVLPSTFKRKVVIERDALVEAVERAAKFAACEAVTFAFGDSLVISAHKASVGDFRAEVACDLDGVPIRLGLNARFLLDALASLAGEIVVEIGDTLSPVIVRSPADPSALFVVMPVRLE